MLKKRIIGLVLVRSGIVVQSIGFQQYLPIGIPEIVINYLDRWGVDEIVVLHIDAHKNQVITAKQVKSYASQCQVPLSIGGGITTVEDIKQIIRSGADKVVINTSLITHPEIITAGSDLFGQQSIIVSIDASRQPSIPIGFINGGKQSTQLPIMDLAKKAVDLGTGEILLNSIDRDGTKQGYDLELVDLVAKEIAVPLIICGGAGHPHHIKMALQSEASAAAVGNLLHFTEHSVTTIKQCLKSATVPIRLDSDMNYQYFNFDEKGRPTKLPDQVLEELRFQHFVEEKI